MKLTFLGTGTSVGVPTIGCQCEVCQSSDPHDKRLRCSAMVETVDTCVVIDCGPDFRQQMLSQTFRKIDAVLLTHIHYDHVGGMDDLRPFCQFGEVNVYADDKTACGLKHTIPYCFAEHRYPGAPKINLHTIEPHKVLRVGSLDILPVQVMHDKLPILGYRFNDFLYITDMKSVAETEWDYFKGVRTLVVNALRFTPDHHSHQSVDDAITFARRIGATHTFLTHMCHDVGLHEYVNNNKLPADIQLAYDGQTVEI